MKENDPAGWDANRRFYSFSANTSGTVLRDHLIAVHHDLYIQTCKERGWHKWLVYVTKRDANINDINDAAPQPQLYTHDNFLNAIVRFIAADDQVNLESYQLIYCLRI